MNELRFFNPYAEIRHTENRLPHWQQEGATYFVTFRLADSIPSQLRDEWANEREAWLRVHREPWSAEIEREYHKRFSGALEQWLDEGHGSYLLRRHDCAKVVAETLRHFEPERVMMISFAVMPNHVHAVFVQNPEWPLEKLIRSWKGFTARQINKLLGRSGSFWQRDYFDRLVRDEEHFQNCVRYIRRNPQKARLSQEQFIVWESDIAAAIF
ncbi:MAG TPA: transposase [Chthoniobacterales bacterium]|nr:transposase [Chthoniobacterales bacterium]